MSDESIEDIRMLRDSIGALVPEGDLGRVRGCRFIKPRFDRDAWRTIREMGWLHLRIPESAGGTGLGVREASALAQLLGRGLVPEPLNAASLALRLMDGLHVDDRIIVAAWQGKATLRDGALCGRKFAVEDAAGADAFVVTLPEGAALVDRNAAGLRLDLSPTHDGGWLGTIDLDGVKAEIVPCPQMDAALDEATLLHAAYLLGLTERAFDMTLDYLRIRKQFGVAIGSFQALQHRASEMKGQLELTRASIDAAASAIDAGQPAGRMVSAARARAGTFARLVAREAVQMHGAIGCTDEADIGLFVRKTMVLAGLYGTEADHRRRYMTLREEA